MYIQILSTSSCPVASPFPPVNFDRLVTNMRFSHLVTLITLTVGLVSVVAQDPFLGEIRVWPIDFAPRGWAFCSGQLLSLNQNTALYSLLGTRYGGDGFSTFGLPDMRGRLPLGAGPGTSGTNAPLGQKAGSVGSRTFSGVASGQVPIAVSNLPAHNHPATFVGQSNTSTIQNTLPVALSAGGVTPSSNGFLSQGTSSGGGIASIFVPSSNTATKVGINGGSGSITLTPQGAVTIGSSGGGTPLSVSLGVTGQVDIDLPPYLSLNYIIALEGIYPSRP